MAIKKLLELMTNPNIALGIEDQTKLQEIGDDVVSGYGVDWDSMAQWREDVDEGLKLIKPATKGRSDGPWDGSANFKTPILNEARIKFGDRASQELLKGNDLVKAAVVGKDPDGEKADRIERVTTVMDWQLAVENKSWIAQQDKLFYDVSCHGHIFKKTYFDASAGHNKSEVIKYPNFAINQHVSCLEEAPRFTHRLFLTPNQVREKILAGVWLDNDIELGTKGDDKDRNETAKDKITEFYEQQTWLDLDGDEYAEPYVVTVHASTGTVMRIRAQYGLDNISVMDDAGVVMTMDKLIEKDEEGKPVIVDDEIMFKDGKRDVIKIDRDDSISEYPFLVNPQDEYLSVGYFHLLGAYCQGINTVSNQLLDAGTLSNTQGGWLARGFRKKLGNMKVAPGQFHQTDISAQDLQTGIRLFEASCPEPMGMLSEADDIGGITDRATSACDMEVKEEACQ